MGTGVVWMMFRGAHRVLFGLLAVRGRAVGVFAVVIAGAAVVLAVLAGGAVAAPGPAQLVLSPSPFGFGPVTTGQSGSQNFVLKNVGSGQPTSALKVTVSGSSAFTITSDGCSGTNLRAGESCTVTLAVCAREHRRRGGDVDGGAYAEGRPAASGHRRAERHGRRPHRPYLLGRRVPVQQLDQGWPSDRRHQRDQRGLPAAGGCVWGGGGGGGGGGGARDPMGRLGVRRQDLPIGGGHVCGARRGLGPEGRALTAAGLMVRAPPSRGRLWWRMPVLPRLLLSG